LKSLFLGLVGDSEKQGGMMPVISGNEVLVPWNRVFLHGNASAANRLYPESSFLPHVAHQIVCKNTVKTEFILGVLQLMVDTINISEYQHVKEKIAEVILALETIKAFLIASEVNAQIDKWGLMTPAFNPLYAALNYYPRIYPRFIEIMQLIGASGLVSIPSEADFHSELKPDLDKYLQSTDRNGQARVQLFRLAWDVCMSAFGSRQTLYERFFFGDPVRLAGNLYRLYDRQYCVDWVKRFLERIETDRH
jgi:4-hydroxyphenylacetate 3-monooxygenase